MFCKGCGKEVPADNKDKFCDKCGTPLEIVGLEEKKVKHQPPLNKILVWGAVLVGAGLILYGLFYSEISSEPAIPELAIDTPSQLSGDDDYSILNEMDYRLEPVGYFSEPSKFDDENINITEWLSYVTYYPRDFSNYSQGNSGQFLNQNAVLASVVKIICTDDEYVYYGSGTNIDSSGYVVTNRHVFEGADYDSCIVGFPDIETGLIKEVYWATPIVDKADKTGHDLAVMYIEEPVFDEEYNIFGYYDRVTDYTFPTYDTAYDCSNTPNRLGEDIFILGYPPISGGALTITNGILSSLYSQDNYLVTSAKIASGNSGGLAVDRNGCYVGVPTAVYLEEDSEQFGEIIDAAFVVDFLEAVVDDVEEYEGYIYE